ncbi:MAG: PHB depolymerase family esterase [Cellvibrionaceae bacterium]
MAFRWALSFLLVVVSQMALAVRGDVVDSVATNILLMPKPPTPFEKLIGGKLYSYLYVPETPPRLTSQRALMVSLHSCIQRNDDMFVGGGWQSVADEYGMVVALPQSSREGLYGSLAGCWNFHKGMSASREESDPKYLLDLVDELLSDTALNIDPNQVYITGFSSGGAMAYSLACMAPEVFAGVGGVSALAAGAHGEQTTLAKPEFGTNEGLRRCLQLAGEREESLQTQLYNSSHGTEDPVVFSVHGDNNANIGIAIHSVDHTLSPCREESLSGASGLNVSDVSAWCDGEGELVSQIMVNGLGHSWPAGAKSVGGRYVDNKHMNYPAWITQWFFENNRRVERE